MCQARQKEAPEEEEVGKAKCFGALLFSRGCRLRSALGATSDPPPSPTSVVVPRGRDGDLSDACEEHLKENGLPEDTKFWCCFYSFRQNHITEDLPYLSACVAQVRKCQQHLNGNSRSVARTEHSFSQCTIGLTRGPFIYSMISVPNPPPVFLSIRRPFF